MPSAPLMEGSRRALCCPVAFSRHGGIYRSDVVSNQNQNQNHTNLGAGCRLPLVGPRAPVQRMRRKKRILPIVRDEFRPAIP